MTGQERTVQIGEQFKAERALFSAFATAAKGVKGVPSLTVGEGPLSALVEPPPDPRAISADGAEFWLRFAGQRHRVRHTFKELERGRFISAIELDTPGVPEGESLNAIVQFDRDGLTRWVTMSGGAGRLDTDPLAVLFNMLAKEMVEGAEPVVLASLKFYTDGRK